MAVKRMKFRLPHDQEAADIASQASRIVNTLPTMTKESFAEDADLNVLVKRFGIDKMPVPPAVLDPRYYGDVEDVFDLRTAIDRIRDAQERFQALPARVRERFANDPARLHDFVMDPANRAEAQSLGLLAAPAAPGAPITSPPTPTPQPSPENGAGGLPGVPGGSP